MDRYGVSAGEKWGKLYRKYQGRRLRHEPVEQKNVSLHLANVIGM